MTTVMESKMAAVEAGAKMPGLEGKIIEAISNSNAAELKSLISQYKQKVDFYDENGMTPLQYAAYKGSKEMVQMLLDQGADVNSCQHEYNYTALHFGALSGSAEVCRVLLVAGAKALATNSVGRIASQMAAFVGNHHIVATINNFIPKSDIDHFTKPQGLQQEPLFPPHLGDQLHKFVMEVNLNPVRVALNLQRSPCLADQMEKVKQVLEAMCVREMKRANETNEVMAFKYHYLSYLVGEIYKIRERHIASKEKKEDGADDKKFDFVELFSRKLLKPGKDGVTLDYQDGFLKEAVREFPFRECTIFHQMISFLASKDSPSALLVITSAVNGQRGFANSMPYCNTCGDEKPAKKCSKCKTVQYCDRECQRLHWFIHKKACTRLAGAPAPALAAPQRSSIDATEISQHFQNLVTG